MRSTVPCSSRPARTRSITYWRLRFSSTTDEMPARRRRWASSRPAGPALTIPTWVRISYSAHRPDAGTCGRGRCGGKDVNDFGHLHNDGVLAPISHTRRCLRRFKKPTGQEPCAVRCGASGKHGDTPCRLLQPAIRLPFGGHLQRRAAQPYGPISFRRPTPYLPRRKSNAGTVECENGG